MTPTTNAPVPTDEAGRLEALRRYRILDTPPDPGFDEITRLAQALCGTPVALTTFIDADRMWVKSSVGMGVKELPRDQALCSHCILGRDLFQIPNTIQDHRFCENPLVQGDPRIRFYAGAPLTTSEGHAIGALCVVDFKPRELTAEQEAALRTLARQVMTRLELLRHRSSIGDSSVGQALLESRARLKLLGEIVKGLTSGGGSDGIIQQTLDQISVYFPGYRAGFGEIGESGKLKLLKSVQPKGMADFTGLEADLTSAPEYLSALRSKSVLIIPDVEKDPRVAPLAGVMTSGGTRAILDVPVHHDDRLVGLLCFDSPLPHEWSAHEIETLQAVAAHLSVTLRDARADQDRRRAEQRLGYLLSSAPVVLYTMKPSDGYPVTWISDTCRAILGDAPSVFSEHPSHRLDRLHPEDRSRIMAELKILPQLGYQVLEYRYQRPDGAVRWMRDEVKLVRDPEGVIVEILGCMVDINEQRDAEAKLRRRERDRLHSNKMEAIGRLAGGVAHDFNNLLTAITGYSDLLGAKLPEGDPLSGHVLEIKKAGDRAASLCRQLLAFSRKQVLRPELLNLNHVLDDIEAMLRRVIGEDIEMKTERGRELLPVKVDRAQIEQVMLNLAANARDAMPRGGALSIVTRNEDLDIERIRATPGLQAGPYVLLQVSDTGIGMDKDVLAHLFEPFFTTKAEGRGTGLGLSTVYGFVRQSGGHLEVSSRPGEGTTFSIYLPHTLGEAPRKEQIDTTKIPIIRGKERVLVVEDSDTVRNLARQILEFHGYTVIDAPNGEEALGKFRKEASKVDLVITDVVMPKMSGPDLVQKLAALKPSVKVLYMSGYPADAVDSDRLVASGFSFLPKPFTPEILAQKVRKVLDSGG